MVTLRVRTAIVTSLTFAILAISLFVTFNATLMGGFLELEDESIRKNVGRALEGIVSLQDEISLKAEEWGAWDDSYLYLSGRNKSYESSNLTYEALSQLHIRHFLLLKSDGKLFSSRFVNEDSPNIEAIPPKHMKELIKVASRAIAEGRKIGGLVQLNGTTFLVGAAPVTNSAGTAPIKGAILFSRDFGQEAVSRLTELTRVHLTINSLGEMGSDPLVSNAIKSSLETKLETTFTADGKIFGVNIVYDILERPILSIMVQLNRDLLRKGVDARNLVTVYILVFTVLALVSALLFLNKKIIAPLREIGTQSAYIGTSQREDIRVSVKGDLEIFNLGLEINRMLDQLADSRREAMLARQIAEQANQAKSMFIARVSHELRTPVAGIIGLNDMLLKRVGDQRGVRELLNMQGVSAEGLLTIINEILDFSTIEQGKLTFENIEFEPRGVAKEAMQVVTGRLLARPTNAPLQLVIDVAPTVARKLKGDPTKLKQILVNLIGNGIKFTQRGNVGLKLDCTKCQSGKQWLQFSVWDTGIGIPASKLASVFEPFTQADESVRRKYQGTGLGLTIVKQMAEGMGGTVSVESVEGSGSTFKVTIPFETVSTAPYDVSGDSTGRGIWPTSFIVIGECCRVRDSVVESLRLLGGSSNGVFERVDHESERAIKDSKLIVLLEDAAQSVEGQKLIKEKTVNSVIVPVISLAQGELRQKIHTEGIRTILSYPVLADDIVTALITERIVSYQDAAAGIVRSLPTCSRPLRILVADDTLTNRIVLEDLLTEAGHSVVCVDDGQKLVERLRPMLTGENDAEGFDIVLTDISMPTMDGYSATREIRALEKASGHHIPIVAITAHILTEEQAKMKASGMDEVLTKPIKPEAVAAVFESLVREN